MTLDEIELYENGGRIVKGVNTTPDVGVDQIKIEAEKFGFKVNKDGVPEFDYMDILDPENK